MSANRRSVAALAALAARFKLLAEPVRLLILDVLGDGEMSVQEIVHATGLGQPHLSRQLGQLAAAGLLRRRKRGTRVYYSVRDKRVIELVETADLSLRKHLEDRLIDLEE